MHARGDGSCHTAPMPFPRRPATEDDKAWLEQLRREVYRDLFTATFGGWDEERHARQWRECWEQGSISIIESQNAPVGMIQLFEQHEVVEVGELQIASSWQNRGIGSAVLRDTIARARAGGRAVVLSTGLRNAAARRLYLRLGFEETAQSETHFHFMYPA